MLIDKQIKERNDVLLFMRGKLCVDVSGATSYSEDCLYLNYTFVGL